MPENSDYIAEYLSGGMSPEEMKDFEARLITDEELNAEYKLMAKGMEYLKGRVMLEEIENDPDLPRVEAEVDAYFNKTREASPDQEQVSMPDEKKFRKALLRAIPAAVLVGVILIIRSLIPSDQAIKLYNRYYEPLSGEVAGSLMIRGPINSNLKAGIDCYVEEDYSCAISYLEGLSEGSFYLGLTQLGLQQFEQALESLFAYREEYPLYPGVNWYLGLAYLRLNNYEEALASFENIPETNVYYVKATKLARKIEKIKAAK